MPSPPPQLPPKREVALALLESAPSLYIHLDPRPENVLVPVWFKKQPQLVLQVGLNMAVPIVDLNVGDDGISCTLSFNRRSEFCRLPWDAIFGLVGEDGRGMIWPDSVPSEVAASAEGRAQVAAKDKAKKPKLRLASAQADEEQNQPLVSAKSGRSGEGSKAQTKNKQETSRADASDVDDAERLPKTEKKSSTSGDRPPYLRLVK